MIDYSMKLKREICKSEFFSEPIYNSLISEIYSVINYFI